MNGGMSPRLILVPVDFSATSDRACDHAAELARAFGARIVLLQVVEPPAYPLPKDMMDALREAASSELERRANELRAVLREVDTRLAEGKPWQEIERAAVDIGADLVILGTHGRRGLARAVLGSVAERVVRTSPVPVLTVPGDAFASRDAAAAALATALSVEGLTGAAFVALSRGALPIAAHVARALSGTVDLWLTKPVVVDGRTVGAVGEDGAPAVDDGVSEEAVSTAQLELREELAEVRGARAPGEVWNRPLVLVADRLEHPAAVVAAAKARRSEKPREIVLAVPIARADALRACEAHVDRAVCLERAYASKVEHGIYRDDGVPSAAEARQLLGGDAARVLT
jgi:nucleotide-binding universal stress UspA family protein/predicted phosphoribosyltransferase